MREAILKAADHIEQHPEGFNFHVFENKPESLNGIGCPLVWIGYFNGVVPDGTESYARQIIEREMGSNLAEFCSHLGAINYSFGPNNLWTKDAATCARALRKYADQFYPLPASVLEIFNTKEIEHEI